LRLDRFVGRYYQQDRFDATRARKHVLDKPLMAGHIDKADTLTASKGEMREAEIDRNAACLFLGQAVGINACQGTDQRSLPMVDMARGSDDKPTHITI
jgi:hypothetical protein